MIRSISIGFSKKPRIGPANSTSTGWLTGWLKGWSKILFRLLLVPMQWLQPLALPKYSWFTFFCWIWFQRCFIFVLFKVFKLATSCCASLNNYMVFNDVDGIYTYALEAEKKIDCLACSTIPKIVNFEDPRKVKLKDLIELLCENIEYQMKNPGSWYITLDSWKWCIYILKLCLQGWPQLSTERTKLFTCQRCRV